MPEKDPMSQPVSLDMDVLGPAKKISAWQKLQDKASGVSLPKFSQPKLQDKIAEGLPAPYAQPSWISDPRKKVEDALLNTKAGKSIKAGVEKASDVFNAAWEKDFLLPELPPERQMIPGLQPDGGFLSPQDIAARTFVDQMARRTYNQLIRPMSSKENIAIMAALPMVPAAGVLRPALNVAMGGPMVASGYKKAIAAHNEKDPAKSRDMYFEALSELGMGTLMSTHSGSDLVKKVGEVPVVKAVKEAVEKSTPIADESGFIHKDFLSIVDRIANEDGGSKLKDPKVLRSLETNDPKQLIGEAKKISGELSELDRTKKEPGKADIAFSRSESPLSTSMFDIVEPEPGQVRIDTGLHAKSYYSPASKAIHTSPNLQTFWHEVGHFRNRIENGEIGAKEANGLVDQYIKDHFLLNKSKSMRKIGDAIMDDFKNPQLAKAEPGSLGIGTTGTLRQELVADAYAWDRSVKHFGQEVAEKNFRPQSTISYALKSNGRASAAMKEAMMTQQMRYKLDSELAANKQKLKGLQDQGRGESLEATLARNSVDRIRTVKGMRSFAKNPKLQPPPSKSGIDPFTQLPERPYTLEVKPNTGRNEQIPHKTLPEPIGEMERVGEEPITKKQKDEINHISWVKQPDKSYMIMGTDKSGKMVLNTKVKGDALADFVGNDEAYNIIVSKKTFGDSKPVKSNDIRVDDLLDVPYVTEPKKNGNKGEIKANQFDPDKHELVFKLDDGDFYTKWFPDSSGHQSGIHTLNNIGSQYMIVPKEHVNDMGVYKPTPKEPNYSIAEYDKSGTDIKKVHHYNSEPEAEMALKGFGKDHINVEPSWKALSKSSKSTIPPPPKWESMGPPKEISNAEFDSSKHAMIWLDPNAGEWLKVNNMPYPIQNMKGEYKSGGLETHVVPLGEIENGKWIGDKASSANDTDWGYIKSGDKWDISMVDSQGGSKPIGSFSKKELISMLPPDVSKVILLGDKSHGVITKEAIAGMHPEFDLELLLGESKPEITKDNFNPDTDAIVFKSKTNDNWLSYGQGYNESVHDISKYLSDQGYENKLVPKSEVENGLWKKPQGTTNAPAAPIEPVTIFDKNTDMSKHSIGDIPFKSLKLNSTEDLFVGTKGSVPDAPILPPLPFGKQRSAGAIIMESDGRVWLIEPAGHFGGYEHTFPKGRVEAGYNTVETAIKEAFEESGLKVQPKEYLGDFEGDTTDTRYFISDRIDGSPVDFGSETQSVKLVTLAEAKNLLNKPRDQKIIDQLIEKYGLKGETPGTTQTDIGPMDIDASKMTKIDGQKGSNPGGWYESPGGGKYYIKEPKTSDHAKNEVLGAKLYQLAGIDVPEISLARTESGKLGVASKEVPGLKKGNPQQLAKAPGTAEGFAVDAWLGNWDVVGLGYDNLMLTQEGKAMRLDTGGSLRYRAQGATKGGQFGFDPNEIRSLRDTYTNQEASMVFGDMTDRQISDSIKRLKDISDESIINLVNEYGPPTQGSVDIKSDLSKKLIKRRDSLIGAGELIESNVQYEGIFNTETPKVTISELTPSKTFNKVDIKTTTQLVSGTPTFKSDTNPMRKAVRSYKGGGHSEQNELERGIKTLDQVAEQTKSDIKHLRQVFDRLNKTRFTGTLWRGVPSRVVENLRVGDFYHDKGFAGWSISDVTGHNWTGQVVLRMEVTGRHKMLNIGKALNEYDGEFETVLYNSKMKIISIKEVPLIQYGGTVSAYSTIKEVWGVLEVD